MTNGEGTGTFGTNAYATVAITSGTINLCASGTINPKNLSQTTCDGTVTSCSASVGSCLLFVQNPAATTSTGDGTPSTTNNTFSGNGTRTLSGLIYLPKQTFAESGNGPIQGCVGIVAKYIDVGGTPTFSNGCLPGNGIGGTTTTATSYSSPYLYQ